MAQTIEHRVEAARTQWDYGRLLVAQGQRERGLELMADCVAFEREIGHTRAEEHAAEVGGCALRFEKTKCSWVGDSASSTTRRRFFATSRPWQPQAALWCGSE